MGTSSSGTGPGPGVPLVPPWVPPLPPPPGDDPEGETEADRQPRRAHAGPTPPTGRPPLAPARRFAAARRSLAKYASEGARADMRNGLGHYVGTGYGGARTATRRMGGTVRTAGILYGVLSSGTATDSDIAGLSARSADDVMDALVETVRPADGTQDAESGRRAIRDALSDLLSRFPNADLLLLSQDQRVFAVERYIARDVYNLFCLDVGKTIHVNAPTASDALSRLRDVRDYIVESVSSRFRALQATGGTLTTSRVSDIASRALQETFEVFEEYVT